MCLRKLFVLDIWDEYSWPQEIEGWESDGYDQCYVNYFTSKPRAVEIAFLADGLGSFMTNHFLFCLSVKSCIFLYQNENYTI